MAKQAVVGIDIGGTKIAGHVSDGTGWHLGETTRATPLVAQPQALDGLSPGTPAYEQACLAGRVTLLDAVIGLSRDLVELARQNGIAVRAIGIGSAGQIDPVHGVVLDASPTLVGWKGARIAETVSAAMGLPVFVENDVRAMALAEIVLGAARHYRDVFCITVGTGIGGAMVRDGRIWYGAHFSAGEVGYLYAEARQTIEERYAGPMIVHRHAVTHPRDHAITLPEIAERARAGDAACRDTITQSAYELGLRIAPVIALLDPEAVVVGGGVPEIGDLWWQPFREALGHFPLQSLRQTPILAAQLGNRAGMIGAGILAMQHLASEPEQNQPDRKADRA